MIMLTSDYKFKHLEMCEESWYLGPNGLSYLSRRQGDVGEGEGGIFNLSRE